MVSLPWGTHNYTIYPSWDDLYLVNSGFGIFTSVSGTAPNRIFNIEWRAVLPGERQCRLRAEVVRGTDSLRCDLRSCGQRQHQRHSGSAEERHHLYAIFLQRHRRCGYWRTKLYAAGLWHAYTDAYRDALSKPNLHAEFVQRAHRVCRYRRRLLSFSRKSWPNRCDGG